MQSKHPNFFYVMDLDNEAVLEMYFEQTQEVDGHISPSGYFTKCILLISMKFLSALCGFQS